MSIDDHEDLVRLPDTSGSLDRALWLSLGVHLVALLVIAIWVVTRGPFTNSRTLTVDFAMANLEEETVTEESRQLAEALAPTETPPDKSDRIAEQNSQAQDQSDVDGSRNVPFFREASEEEIIARQTLVPPATPPSAQQPPAQMPPQPQAEQQPQPEPQQPETPAPKEPEPAPPKSAPPSPKPAAAIPKEVAKADSKAQKPSTPAPEKASEATASSLTPSQDQAVARGPETPGETSQEESKGRVDSGVKNEGIAAFEAVQSQLAPYLKEIRKRVERNWNTGLHTKYSGTSPTKAVLDCAIAPDGTIASLVVIEEGESVSYSAICREAIEKAAPFGPFPFQTPDMYRSKNLEIRWTFNFLRK